MYGVIVDGHKLVAEGLTLYGANKKVQELKLEYPDKPVAVIAMAEIEGD